MGWKLIASVGTLAVIGAALTARALDRKPAVAQNFQLYNTRGDLVNLSDYHGKVVVLDFWASTSTPSRAAIPVLERISQDYKERGVQVLGVNVRDSQDPAQTMQDLGASYPALVAGDDVAQSYGIETLPTVLVIDQDGQIVYRDSGFSAILEKHLDDVLDKQLTRGQE